MKAFQLFLFTVLLTFVFKGCVAQTCDCVTCSLNPFNVPARTYHTLESYTCSSTELVSLTLNIATTDSDLFKFYTVDAANYALYESGSNFNYLSALSSNTAVSCYDIPTPTGDGVSSVLYVLVYCDNSIETCDLEYYNVGTCTATVPPTTAAPTTAPTTTSPTKAPHSLAPRLGSSILGGLLLGIVLTCAVLSF